MCLLDPGTWASEDPLLSLPLLLESAMKESLVNKILLENAGKLSKIVTISLKLVLVNRP